jgi:YbbR domain-containing protein
MTLQQVRGLLLDNIWWKLLSLVVAASIWAIVANEPELGTVATVRLEYKNLPDDLEISSEPISTVALELRGPSALLRDAASGGVRPEVILDMTSVQPGERTFAIGDGNVFLGRGVRLVRAIPSEARFRFERRWTVNVTVQPRFSGDGANGYTVAQWEVSPKELVVVGPASHVQRITTVYTDPVDVSNVAGTAIFHVNAFLNDVFARFQSGPQVRVSVTMKRAQ